MKRLVAVVLCLAALWASRSNAALPGTGNYGRGWFPSYLSGCKLWLDIERDDAASVTVTSGTVSAWTDLTRNGNNGTGQSGKRPTYTARSGSTWPIVTFNAQAIEINSVVCATTCTVAMRFKNVAAPSGAVWVPITLRQAAGADFFGIYVTNLANWKPIGILAHLSDVAAAPVGFSPTLDTSNHTLVVTYNNGTRTSTGSYVAYYDGVVQTLAAQVATTSVNAANIAAIGAAVDSAHTILTAVNMQIPEVIVDNRALSSREAVQLARYLAARPW